MNQPSRSAALVICFFFGCLGLHWLYLNQPNRALPRLVAGIAVLPAALLLAFVAGLLDPAHAVSFFLVAAVLAALTYLTLALLALGDFFCLLADQ